MSTNKKRKQPLPNGPGVAAASLHTTQIPIPFKRRFGDPNLYCPTHKQFARLVTRLVPPDQSATVLSYFDQMNVELMSKKIRHPKQMNRQDLIGKTPKQWIQNSLRLSGLNCSIEEKDSIGTLNQPRSYGYFCRCILNRQWKRTRQDLSSQFAETITKQRIQRKRNESEASSVNQGDEMWYDWLLLLPHSGVFYVLSIVCSSAPGLTSLPISWLRLCKSSGLPAKDSYVKSICNIWAVDLLDSTQRRYFTAYHFDDYEDGMPMMAPDCFLGGVALPQDIARQRFRNAMNTVDSESNSFRTNCRRYVRGSFHKELPSTCFLYDHRVGGDATFELTCRNKDGSPREMSLLQVVDVRHDYRLMSLLSDGSRRIHNHRGNCRQHNNDGGQMHGVGRMVCSHLGKSIHKTKATSLLSLDGLLPAICRAARNALWPTLYSVIPTMIWRERECSQHTCDDMGGDRGITASMNLSNGLRNASHYDINDGSVGCSVWTELISGDSSNWYFVVPNVLIGTNGRTYQGLALCVNKGTAIAWDGRIVRHGTSDTQFSTGNSTFGWFWSADIIAMRKSMEDAKPAST